MGMTMAVDRDQPYHRERQDSRRHAPRTAPSRQPTRSRQPVGSRQPEDNRQPAGSRHQADSRHTSGGTEPRRYKTGAFTGPGNSGGSRSNRRRRRRS
jgi:hypothetical protein